jgi:hypothetical protein
MEVHRLANSCRARAAVNALELRSGGRESNGISGHVFSGFRQVSKAMKAYEF